MNMSPNKSTRWDCDVRLWRGIPYSTPSFHGWIYTGSDPPSVDTNFYVCHHCDTNVPESEVYQHPCWDEPIGDNENEPSEEPEENIGFIIATEDNMGDNGRCFLCKNKMKLEYDIEVEDWILPGCIVVEGKTIHQECHRNFF